jgi:hypothetical protein
MPSAIGLGGLNCSIVATCLFNRTEVCVLLARPHVHRGNRGFPAGVATQFNKVQFETARHMPCSCEGATFSIS